ncbi:MAG: hypothetical protein ACRDL2_09650 [Gaiellaceae bacterium]
MSQEQSTREQDGSAYVAPAGIEVGTVKELTQTKSGQGGDSYTCFTLTGS